MSTVLTIEKTRFLINGKLTYSEINDCPEDRQGLLMNSRMIQGIFDEASDPSRFARYGFDEWDPNAQTDRLIESLPEWYAYGLRAITVGFQGGGPCFTVPNLEITNNPFGEDGKSLDPAYAERMDRIIKACDALGMVVIPSYFYGNQTRHMNGDQAIIEAVKTASRWLKDGGYTNIIIEIANEQDIRPFKEYSPICHSPYGMAHLIRIAREESGGMPVGCSSVGNSVHEPIARESDVVIIHGNGCSRQRLYNLINKTRQWSDDRPVLVNEDSQANSNLDVCVREGVSWGYYNNMTKQEPPSYYGILPGEDTYFAHRMAKSVGIETAEMPEEDQYYLQGLEPHMTYNGERWLRLASLYPEKIDYVEFFRNGELYHRSYDDPFPIDYKSNWRQGPIPSVSGDEWKAVVYLSDGRALERSGTVV